MNSIIEYLEASCASCPEAVAVADGEGTLSFSRLQAMAWGLGRELLDRGLRGRAVGIYAQRDRRVIAAMLGCAAAGCCYVPLNPDAPAEKLQKILDHAGVSLILGFADGEYEAPGTEHWRLDRSFPVSAVRPEVERKPSDPLYIIYTSGSTGEPKGIRKSHGAVMDFIEAYVEELGFDNTEILGNQTPFCFDASAKDIYLMLRTGARMEIIPSDRFLFPVRLIEYLNERRITFISWVPSALAIVARLRTFRDILPTTLRRVAFVGEVFPLKDLEAWRAALPEIEYINLYGSSELAGVAALYHIPMDGQPIQGALPIGKPLKNSRIYLMEDGKLVPDRGEMLVASAALADEYIHDPEKTAAVFETIDIDGVPTRVLHTGDWARYDENGNLIFLARSDAQIKYKGYRIELGEIEAAVNELPYIGRACVLYNADKERITAFVTTDRKGLRLRDLNGDLEGRLVDYMLPRKLTVLDEMPLNANGKIDRPYLKTLL